jgi:valyl-tRNA synthetase
VDREFGTGVMTITPWHSQIDFEIAERHGLDMEQIIDWRGKLLPIAAEFEGMKIAEARGKIVEKLREKGLVVDVDESYKNVVKRCYKCSTMIEPQVKDQWFVKMEPLTKLVIDAVERDELIGILPDYEKKILLHWMKNSIDWNISRQIVWGIPIPAWFKGDEIKASRTSPGDGWVQDPDTFDTWFSSGQWPLLTLGYPDSADFKTYYPTSIMETGADLVFKWVPRMIIFGLYLAKQVPFKQVYFHGMVNDAQNKKMSKSKGNVVSPIELAERFGADALRMALVVGTPAGSNIPLSEEKIKGYKHFANKLWNIARFVLENAQDADPQAVLNEADQALADELAGVAKDVTADLEGLRIYLAAEKLYHYIWDRFAAEILEESKPVLQGADAAAKISRQALLLLLLSKSIALLHPFMPFVTEEIYQSLPGKRADFLMVERWPTA